jgi:hypothetical protein
MVPTVDAPAPGDVAHEHAHERSGDRGVIERPRSLTILCGVWFVLGAYELLTCLLDYGRLIGFQISSAGSPYPAEIAGMVPFLIAGGHAITLLHTALAVLIVVSAIHLWKLRSWARTSLEVMSWLGLLVTVGFGLLGLVLFLETTSRMPAKVRDQIDWIGWVVLAIIAVLSIAHGVSIGILRGRRVREAIAAASVDAASRAGAESLLPHRVPSFPGG